MAAIPIGLPILTDAESERTNGVFKSTITWTLQVEISDVLVDMLPSSVAAAFAAYLPFEGNVHPLAPLATCRGVSCKKTEDNGVYTFTAKYSDENSTDKEKGTDDNPLKDRPIVLPVAGLVTSAMTRDRDDEGILNSAGDPLIVERENQILGFKVTSNQPGIPGYVEDLVDSVNDSVIEIYGLSIQPERARFVLPTDWWSEPKSRNNIQYFEFKFEILLDFRDHHKGWPMDAGFREKLQVFEVDENGDVVLDPWGDPVPVLDENGDPVFRVYAITEDADGSEPSEPVPLDGSGARLVLPTPSTTWFRETGKYRLADYLQLPGVS